MARNLSRLFNIRPAEWPRFSVLYLMGFLFVMGLVWGETTLEAAFLKTVGLSALPLFLVIKAVASIPAFALYTAFADRVANSRLMIAILLGGSMIITAGLYLLNRGWNNLAYPLLYLVVFVPFYDVFAVHWFTYVSGFYNTRTAKRIIPLLGTANGISAITAGLTLPLLNRTLTPGGVITIWLGILLSVAVLVWALSFSLRGKAEEDQKPAARRAAGSGGSQNRRSYVANMQEGFHYVTQSSFLRWMSLSMLVLMLLLTFTQYQTGKILLAEFPDADDMANFIAMLTAITSLIMLPFQLFWLNRAISRIGVGNANLIFPVGTVFFSGALIFWPMARIQAAAGYFTRTNFWYDFGRLINNLLYNAAPLRAKEHARAFITGLVVPISLLIGGAILLTPAVDLSWFVPTGIGLLAAAYLLSMIIIRRQYSQALIALLEQEDYSFLAAQEASELAVTEPVALHSLEKRLEESTSPRLTVFIAKLISNIGGKAAIPILARAAGRGEAPVRATILDILAASEIRDRRIRQLFTDYLADPHPKVRRSAIAGLESFDGGQNPKYLEQALRMLQDADIKVRIQVLPALLGAPEAGYRAQAYGALAEILDSRDPLEQARGVSVLGRSSEPEAIERLITCLVSPEDAVRLEAALAMEQLSAAGQIPERLRSQLTNALLGLQRDPVERVRQASLTILGHVGSPQTHRQMLGTLADPSLLVRKTAVEVMAGLGKGIVPMIHPQLDAPDPQLRKMAVMILSRVDSREFTPLVSAQITGSLLAIYRQQGQLARLAKLGNHDGIDLLRRTLQERTRALTEEIFYLLTAIHEAGDVEIIFRSLRSGDARVRANAVEALVSMTSPQTATLVAPLFDPKADARQMLYISEEIWAMQHPETADLLRELLADTKDPWLGSMVTYALGEFGQAILQRQAKQHRSAEQRQSNGSSPAAGNGNWPRGDGDLAVALVADKSKANGKEKLARHRRPTVNPLDLLTGDDGETSPRGKDYAKPAKTQTSGNGAIGSSGSSEDDESSTNVNETMIGQNSVRDLHQLAIEGDASTAKGLAPGEDLFSLPEIEMLLARSFVHPHPDVQMAARAANRLMSGKVVTDWATKEEAVLSTIEKIIFLKEVPFFQGMTVEQLKILARACEEQFFPEDTRIYDEGDLDSALYLVISGRVGIEREGAGRGSYAGVETVEAHSSFGETNLFDNSPRDAAAVAFQDTLALRLRREPLMALARQHPQLSLELINVLSQRLRESTASFSLQHPHKD